MAGQADHVDVHSFRSYNGSFNNLQKSQWGIEQYPLIRRLPIAFADGFMTPTGGRPSKLVSPRVVSNAIFGRQKEHEVKFELTKSAMVMFWGQFIDHDITFSWDTSIFASTDCDPFPIPVPKGDEFYDSENVGGKNMPFCRTAPVDGTGTGPGNVMKFPNFITAWMDNSQVYGFTNDITDALRAWQGGLLKSSQGPDGEYLPLNNVNGKPLTFMASSDKTPQTQLFAAGDFRANENVMLVSLQTLFLREHNRRARELAQANPTWTDEQLFQSARKMVNALFQKITYEEYLPVVLGKKLPTYAGYNHNVNPAIAEFFSTVAFRFGHDQIGDVIMRLDQNFKEIPEGNMLMRDAFFDVSSLRPHGISCFLRGAVATPNRYVDGIFEDDVRHFLFGIGPAVATDLAARNMQRARDIGMGFYNDARRAYGLTPITNFAQLTSDTQVVGLLNQVYGANNVAVLDAFVGGLLEAKVPGGEVGPLFAAAIADQFRRIRDGDRFFYLAQGQLTAAELEEVQCTRLSDIILRNTDSISVPADAFNLNNAEVLTKGVVSPTYTPHFPLDTVAAPAVSPDAPVAPVEPQNDFKVDVVPLPGAEPVPAPVVPGPVIKPVVPGPVVKPVVLPPGWGGIVAPKPVAPVVARPVVAPKPIALPAGWGARPVIMPQPVAKPVVPVIPAGWGGIVAPKPIAVAPKPVAVPIARPAPVVAPKPVVPAPVFGRYGMKRQATIADTTTNTNDVNLVPYIVGIVVPSVICVVLVVVVIVLVISLRKRSSVHNQEAYVGLVDNN